MQNVNGTEPVLRVEFSSYVVGVRGIHHVVPHRRAQL